MKNFAFTVLCFMLFNSCYQPPERNCKTFQKGTFEFETILNGELVKTTFIRNDSIEIDYFQGKTDTSSIRWINDCEYIVQKLHPNSMAEEKAIHMKILSTDKDTYTFEYALVGSAKKQKGTARKIE
ncbi:DNA topoisomerase IV [Aquimarina sp. U1-2]|uniref:DNA topoisomerase IV n=1 Tax=Aquimarina sp. U1-2 TaxID=2823141 RepID=UPI001AECBE49|nr:DNA topoisomerase IV [Aquimarina sp. U1-2]MBP2831961.1 DNA topoisomerase IV [Aquimarina sp. U1-2]